MLSKEDFAKYPFTSSATTYIRELGITIEDLVKEEYFRVLYRAKERIKEAIDRAQVTPDTSDVDVELLSYPVAIMLTLSSGSRPLIRRVANAEAKRCLALLQLEEDEKLLEVVRDAFNWEVGRAKIKIGERLFDFYLDLRNYLKAATHFRSPYWKLVNRTVRDGAIYLKKSELARLAVEELKNRMAEKAPLNEPLPEELSKIVDEIVSYYRSKFGQVEEFEDANLLSKIAGEYPPCIRKMIEDVKSGKSLPHTARFAVTTFLLNIGKTVDEVIELFKNVADFDESKTRYQVEHIAGERGSKVRYAPPGCNLLKSFGLCTPDEKCKHIRHPLAYYRRYAKFNKGARKDASEII